MVEPRATDTSSSTAEQKSTLVLNGDRSKLKGGGGEPGEVLYVFFFLLPNSKRYWWWPNTIKNKHKHSLWVSRQPAPPERAQGICTTTHPQFTLLRQQSHILCVFFTIDVETFTQVTMFCFDLLALYVRRRLYINFSISRANFLTTLRSHLDVTCSCYFC